MTLERGDKDRPFLSESPPALVGRGGGVLPDLTVRFENNTVSKAKYVFLGEGARLLGDCDLGFEDADDDSAFL